MAASEASKNNNIINKGTALIVMSRFCVTQYRTEGVAPGAFRRLGTIHLHIDGAGRVDLVTSLIKELEAAGCPGKLTAVGSSVPGPQRLEHPETYASHTPVTGSEEQLEYFSTTSIANRPQALEVINRVLPRVEADECIVLELERIIATVEKGCWVDTPVGAVSALYEHEVAYKRNPTLPFEIHHAFDVPGDVPPLALDDLLEDTTRIGVRVGGWFTFIKDDDTWSYRSNAFVKTPDLRKHVMGEHDALDAYLKSRGLRKYRLWTIVEQVLGIWRTPLRRRGVE